MKLVLTYRECNDRVNAQTMVGLVVPKRVSERGPEFWTRRYCTLSCLEEQAKVLEQAGYRFNSRVLVYGKPQVFNFDFDDVGLGQLLEIAEKVFGEIETESLLY